LDLIVVVDGSDSITAKDFVTLKTSLADYQDALSLADDQAKFGLVLYSSDVSATISLYQILCNITWNKTIEKLKRNQNI
jgi:collagen type VI alpha